MLLPLDYDLMEFVGMCRLIYAQRGCTWINTCRNNEHYLFINMNAFMTLYIHVTCHETGASFAAGVVMAGVVMAGVVMALLSLGVREAHCTRGVHVCICI